MIEVQITKDMVSEALERAAQVPLLRNSDTNGHGQKIAALSDLMVQKTWGGRIMSNKSYDFDWISPKLFLFEIKAKERNVVPQPWYNCAVKDYNTAQKCDYYLFTSIFGDYSRGWILGYIKKEKFYEKATFFAGGEVDPDPRGDRYVFPSSCYNLKVEDLICK
jgi:hypothetical protein